MSTNAYKESQKLVGTDIQRDIHEKLREAHIGMNDPAWKEKYNELLKNSIGEEKFNKYTNLQKTMNTGGRSGKITGWIGRNIIGDKANKELGRKASGLFRGNRTAAAITAIAAPTLIGGGIAYGVGHKKKNNK